jgi:hypothetical protein
MKLKNDMVNLIVRVEHHLCPLYCGVVDRRRIIAFLLLTISELIIIPYHIMGINDALPSQSGLQCHSSVSFRFGYFLKSYLYFRKSNGSFSRKLPFLRELLISAAKIQIISEKLVQISENRATLTILSINHAYYFYIKNLATFNFIL